MSAEEADKWRGRAKPMMPLFPGPEDVREAFIRAKGVDWTASYIDPAVWLQASRSIVAATHVAFDRITSQASGICANLKITVRRPVDPNAHRSAA